MNNRNNGQIFLWTVDSKEKEQIDKGPQIPLKTSARLLIETPGPPGQISEAGGSN